MNCVDAARLIGLVEKGLSTVVCAVALFNSTGK